LGGEAQTERIEGNYSLAVYLEPNPTAAPRRTLGCISSKLDLLGTNGWRSLLAWKIVPTLFVWLVLIGAGISMFLLARESPTPRQAVLVAALFAANPYHFLLIYYRSDFAELLASALLPLGVVWVAREGWRRVPILALVVALIWLSNAPAAVIAVYSLVFLFLVAYAVRRDLRLLVYGAAAKAGGNPQNAVRVACCAGSHVFLRLQWGRPNRSVQSGVQTYSFCDGFVCHYSTAGRCAAQIKNIKSSIDSVASYI
jgi:hypothetical protein